MDSIPAAHDSRPPARSTTRSSSSYREHFQNQIECSGSTLLRSGISMDYKCPKRLFSFRLGTRPKTLHGAIPRITQSLRRVDHRCGTTVISRRAAMRSSRGGWVLKREAARPPPNIGFTMHKVEVDGERAVVGIRWL